MRQFVCRILGIYKRGFFFHQIALTQTMILLPFSAAAAVAAWWRWRRRRRRHRLDILLKEQKQASQTHKSPR